MLLRLNMEIDVTRIFVVDQLEVMPGESRIIQVKFREKVAIRRAL